MHVCVKTIAVCILLTTIAGCSDRSGGAGEQGPSEPVLYATNYPLAYFAERIAGNTAAVVFPEINGDPAFWQPGDPQITEMQAATLILTNGATYEKWAKTVSLPSAKTIDTSKGFEDRFIQINGSETHSHGKEGEHSHAGTAFTTWMDFNQARQQAEAVRDALLEAMPDEVETIRANAKALLAEIDDLHIDMKSVTATMGERPLMASHPVYQYFARQYGLNMKAVLWEPETVPSEQDMADLAAILADHKATWMVWEGGPVTESVEMLQAIGVNSVIVDPCGNRPAKGDWLTGMKQNIANLKAINTGSPK